MSLLVFLVALIYSSVGHGGASGYLAVLSFFGFPHEQMAVGALCLNLLVAGMAFWSFFRARHFSWKLTAPFLVLSVPAAFVGGLIRIPKTYYALLLAVVLVWAAVRLLLDSCFKNKSGSEIQAPPLPQALAIGGLTGLLSGIVGVGGGIFLSPLLLFFNWATPKQTAAASALFIFVNSFAGLAGRAARGALLIQFSPALAWIVLAAFAGGLLGSRLGAKYFSNIWIRRLLALVLLIAAIKLFRSL